MRNLTIGGLIVIGGLVAALPFKRISDSAKADTASHLATGPSAELAVSEASVPFERLYVSPEAYSQDFEPANAAGFSTSRASESVRQNAAEPDAQRWIPSDAAPRPRRDLRLPLTYDDLAVPLASPHYRDNRFGAVASSPVTPASKVVNPASQAVNPALQAGNSASQSIRSTRQAASSGSPTFPSTDPTGFERMPLAMSTSAFTRSVEGRLASDSQPTEATGRPSTTIADSFEAIRSPPAARVAEPTRQRYWIRQPQ